MPNPAGEDLLAQILQAKRKNSEEGATATTPATATSSSTSNRGGATTAAATAATAATASTVANNKNAAMLLASLQKRHAGGGGPDPSSTATAGGHAKSRPHPLPLSHNNKPSIPTCPAGQLFQYDESLQAFLFDPTSHQQQPQQPTLVEDPNGNVDTNVSVPLAPCIYRLTDYTYAKQEPVLLHRCIIKLGVLRCLWNECQVLNQLLWNRFSSASASAASIVVEHNNDNNNNHDRAHDEQSRMMRPGGGATSMEEDELGKARFMELLSNCGVYQKVSELILQRTGQVSDAIRRGHNPTGNSHNPYRIPQIHVKGLEAFLQALEDLTPSLSMARNEIKETQTVSFFPGLGELFTPGSKLVCFPDGMEGIPVGCSCVQSWYAEELNQATNKIKRRFILVVEFMVSVGTELVFVAASEVYPEFHDTSRNVPMKDLTHRKLWPEINPRDQELVSRMTQRGEFYASVATKNHYLEYQPHSFYPIMGGAAWATNHSALRPLSKGGRVMIDVHRGILENHLPFRGTSGMSDTVKEAIKLFEQNKRTGIAVPFRTARLPEFEGVSNPSIVASQSHPSTDQPIPPKTMHTESDRSQLWQAWPCLVGFSFTSRVWGKILLSLPKPHIVDHTKGVTPQNVNEPESPRRASVVKLGVERAGLGGFGECGSLNYISFQEKAFEQLVLDERKKELIRAVARNAGGGTRFDGDDDYDSEEDSDMEDEEDMGLDVVANKGAASIFLLNGPPGCGKTLTAEAIAELLKKPLYVVTAGDLGITASEVEKTLGSVLELCQTWDALVLMDEADIFLETRSSTEIQRNALVCVMLRLLEYYSGCLFLSSNRAAASIDAAIASRITVMLSYPPLDFAGRSKVWKNLVGLVPVAPVDPTTGQIPSRIVSNPRKASKYRVDFTDDDFQTLSMSYLINGRQIKNSIVLARALARERGVPLSLPILRLAVTAVAGERGESDCETTY
jgi:ATPase family associated with various cellular activities (AAA)